MQAIFSIIIFVLLSSQDGFSTKWKVDEHTGIKHAPALYNGIFSTIAFLVGAISSIVSGFIGMKIATYANARTALEARKGIAAAFAVGELLNKSSSHLLASSDSHPGLSVFLRSVINCELQGHKCLGSSISSIETHLHLLACTNQNAAP